MAASVTPSAQSGAVNWLVELRSGEAGPADRAAFADWLAADPAHQAAWQRLTGAVDHTFGATAVAQPGTAKVIDSVLSRATALTHQRRRVLRGVLGLAGMGMGTAWIGHRSGLLPDVTADLHTATAERRSYALQGGGTLLLDARSSADLDSGANGQRVVLRVGQVIASARPQPDATVILDSGQVEVTIQQGRCLMRLEAGRTLVCALTDPVTLKPRSAALAGQVLPAGQAVYLGSGGVQAVDPADVPLLATWEHGILAVRDGRLGDVVARLQSYRRGLLHITDDAAALRLSGTYPLDDSDAVLQALADTLPITVRRHTGGWLVRIERAA